MALAKIYDYMYHLGLTRLMPQKEAAMSEQNHASKKPKKTVVQRETVDRTQFSLSDEKWAAFQAALDAPVRDLPRLRALLQAPEFFDQAEPNDFACAKHGVFGSEWPWPTGCQGCVDERRWTVLASVLETPLTDLVSFLDLLAEDEMTDRRIADAQHVMGLCTPVCSHLQFPAMGLPSCGRELLREWLRRQKVRAATEDAENRFGPVFEALAEGAEPAKVPNPTQADEEARIRQIRIDHGVFD
jgi:hypothetical protein